jgi:hypothetical protein
VNVLQDGSVPCSTDIRLFWEEPFDPNGIKGYDLVIMGGPNESDKNPIEQFFVTGTDFQLGELPVEYCEWYATVTVRAVDNLDASGPASTLMFRFWPP